MDLIDRIIAVFKGGVVNEIEYNKIQERFKKSAAELKTATDRLIHAKTALAERDLMLYSCTEQSTTDLTSLTEKLDNLNIMVVKQKKQLKNLDLTSKVAINELNEIINDLTLKLEKCNNEKVLIKVKAATVGVRKFNCVEIKIIRKLKSDGGSTAEIAELYRVDSSTISRICNFITYKDCK